MATSGRINTNAMEGSASRTSARPTSSQATQRRLTEMVEGTSLLFDAPVTTRTYGPFGSSPSPQSTPRQQPKNTRIPALAVKEDTAQLNVCPPKRKKSSPSVHTPRAGPSTSRQDRNGERPENRVDNLVRHDATVLPSMTTDHLHYRHRHDARHHRPHPSVDSEVHEGSGEKQTYARSIAGAEFERMRKEIENLKEGLHESKKITKRHAKKLEDNKAELNAAVQALKDLELELSASSARGRANEELLSTIESCVQCQICMDLPDKPFSLAPCGHILCLSCLQEWFRKSPPSLDDVDIDPDELTDPSFVLMKKKTCPSCRATVKHRPAPVFMVKSVVTALRKAKPSLITASASQGRADGDARDVENPWNGIFPSSEEEDGDDSTSSSPGSDSTEDFPYESLYGRRMQFRVHRRMITDSDSEEDSDEDISEADEGEDDNEQVEQVRVEDYVVPTWQPPHIPVNYAIPAGLSFEDHGEILSLLQRGCSWDMLQTYHVSYSDDEGIVVQLHSLDELVYPNSDDDEDSDGGSHMNRLSLGWNISLEGDDPDGSIYLMRVLQELRDYPSHYYIRRRNDFPRSRDVTRLVRVSDIEENDSTDMEVWADAEDF